MSRIQKTVLWFVAVCGFALLGAWLFIDRVGGEESGQSLARSQAVSAHSNIVILGNSRQATRGPELSRRQEDATQKEEAARKGNLRLQFRTAATLPLVSRAVACKIAIRSPAST